MTLWYLARAAGFVALIAATASVSMGALGSSSRPLPAGASASFDRHLDRRLWMQLVHRSAAVVTLAMLLLHLVLIVIDQYVPVTLSGALVPFTAGYRPVALGLGSLAAYGFIVVALTGALRGRLAQSPRAARAWRSVHLTAYAAWVLSMGHGFLAGTDTGAWWSWAVYVACAAAVAGAVTTRFAALARRRTAPITTARRHVLNQPFAANRSTR